MAAQITCHKDGDVFVRDGEFMASVTRVPAPALVSVKIISHGHLYNVHPHALARELLDPLNLVLYLASLMQRGDSDEVIREIAEGKRKITFNCKVEESRQNALGVKTDSPPTGG